MTFTSYYDEETGRRGKIFLSEENGATVWVAEFGGLWTVPMQAAFPTRGGADAWLNERIAQPASQDREEIRR
jgi:hypothetical protein